MDDMLSLDVADRGLKRMTADQRSQWQRDGYFIIENALSMQEVGALVDEVDRLDALSQSHGRESGSYLDVVNIVDRPTDRSNELQDLGPRPNRRFIDLLDHPCHTGFACELMGGAIHALATQLMVRPPNPKPPSRWHRDTMAPYGFPDIDDRIPLQQFRIGWFLTDLPAPDMGNFCVLPGSHRAGFPVIPNGLEHALRLTSFDRYQELDDICEGLPGARQITVQAGDAVVFHNSLFHAVSRNSSSVSRKNLYYVYGPWWARLSDRMTVSPEAVAMCSPVQRQLIGATLEPSAASPTPADERLPLVEAFEGKSFKQIFDGEVESYVRRTQSDPKSGPQREMLWR